MQIPLLTDITTEGQATDLAIEWQGWQAGRSMSYAEALDWQSYFEELANKFNLTDEFRENGII